jgi:hypothetical protein
MASCDLLQVVSLLLIQWTVHISYPTPPRPTSATLLFHTDSFSSSSSSCGRSTKCGSRLKGTVEDGGGGVLARSCTAEVSAAESLRTRLWAVLTVVVDSICVELLVVGSSRLREVLLYASAEIVVRYKVWGYRRCSIQLSQRQRRVHSRGHKRMSTIV